MIKYAVAVAAVIGICSAIPAGAEEVGVGVGANGVTDEYQCGRHMLNLESVYTYEGTHDIHTLVVGQDVTGLAAFDS